MESAEAVIGGLVQVFEVIDAGALADWQIICLILIT